MVTLSAGCGTDLILPRSDAAVGEEKLIFSCLLLKRNLFKPVFIVKVRIGPIVLSTLDHATSVHYVTNEGYYGDDTLFSFCNDVMLDKLRCVVVVLTKIQFASLLGWESLEKLVALAKSETHGENLNEPEVINANDVLGTLDGSCSASAYRRHKPILAQSFGESVSAIVPFKTMVFADVQAFSKVDEAKTTMFVDVFHGNVSRMMDELGCKPAFLNSWGDSFFGVFDDLNDALKLSMAIRDFFVNGRWDDLASDGKLDVRISMHAGPVYEEFDPILKKRNFFGRHVNQAPALNPLCYLVLSLCLSLLPH